MRDSSCSELAFNVKQKKAVSFGTVSFKKNGLFSILVHIFIICEMTVGAVHEPVQIKLYSWAFSFIAFKNTGRKWWNLKVSNEKRILIVCGVNSKWGTWSQYWAVSFRPNAVYAFYSIHQKQTVCDWLIPIAGSRPQERNLIPKHCVKSCRIYVFEWKPVPGVFCTELNSPLC